MGGAEVPLVLVLLRLDCIGALGVSGAVNLRPVGQSSLEEWTTEWND